MQPQHPRCLMPNTPQTQSQESLYHREPDPELQASGFHLIYRSATPAVTPVESCIPFRPAANRLVDSLYEAANFFAKILSSFGEETTAIRSYASPAVLNELWKCKLNASDEIDVIPLLKQERSRWALPQKYISGWRKKRKGKGKGKEQAQSANSNQKNASRTRLDRAVRVGYRDYARRVKHDLWHVHYARWPSQEDGESSTGSGCTGLGGDLNRLEHLHRRFEALYDGLDKLCGQMHHIQSCQKFIDQAQLLLICMSDIEDWWEPKDKGRGLFAKKLTGRRI
ncbi:hypothetical protein CNMCM5793_006325 [Aspergillus hiratsukae]|uniref:Uncharacterized protein n=1 Tax=Aspergillus hiratsukae TaxID=1194566 RepID=A0A8H6PHB3_9EURO|nr:hypothetical protein CNMCM5793_006325 [Aspergillus hiratsukae]KAF7158770.1 hypothetical protein CNMCM6106_005566 [Aspergillus hiratsukae]